MEGKEGLRVELQQSAEMLDQASRVAMAALLQVNLNVYANRNGRVRGVVLCTKSLGNLLMAEVYSRCYIVPTSIYANTSVNVSSAGCTYPMFLVGHGVISLLYGLAGNGRRL